MEMWCGRRILRKVWYARRWNEEWLNEVTGFPNVEHDEYVDTLSGVHSILIGDGRFDISNWEAPDTSGSSREEWEDRSVLS
jgi:hypothetical protein